MKIARKHAVQLMKQGKGRIFTVSFITKSGTYRTINGRLGVRKGTNGTGMSYDPAQKGLLTVCDMKLRQNQKELGYRMVRIDSIFSLKIEGEQYEVV